MKILQGQGVSKGIEKGILCFYHRVSAAVEQQMARDPAAERARLEAARSQAMEQLEAAVNAL